jgi:hypothetical protein
MMLEMVMVLSPDTLADFFNLGMVFSFSFG